ncbi:MAG: tRNA (adenosine(37)-N6)-dimethylallyltransferase MiaA, partial [Chitinophagales bacterium]|nr:tRNA (adenosine(37)-N6)-dimethylallyltransferase MiaA [Hyphomicrobiales bacterium]
PHRLYGHVPAREVYSTGRWLADVEREIGAARAAGKLPVIVGGTGLYFKALLKGLSPVPDIPPEVRAYWRVEAGRLGAEGLYAVLQGCDSEMAGRLAPSDVQRLTRALEVFHATGRSLARWQEQQGRAVLDANACAMFVAEVKREELYRRLDRRFLTMIEGGALDEAAALMHLGLDVSLPAMRAIGVRPLLRHLRGDCTLADAIAEGQGETRRYAKRQTTWLRSHMISWNALETQQMERTKHEVNDLIRSKLDLPPHRA